MAITAEWGVELELSGPGGGWTDVSRDVRAQAPITIDYGINGQTQTDRVASAGRATFALNNSEFNSAKALGYYSPWGVYKRPGFDFNIGCRVWLKDSSGDKYYKHVGRLSEINAAPGAFGSRLARVASSDIWEDLASVEMPNGVGTQVGKRADQLLSLVLDALSTQPTARALGTGADTFTYALDGAIGQSVKVREALNQIALSEQGYIYTRGDYVSGDVFTFEPRGARALLTTNRAVFTDDMTRDGLVVSGNRGDLFRSVSVTVHPATVSDTTGILWSLEHPFWVDAGATVPVTGSFSDPATSQACGGSSIVAPTTDNGQFSANTAADGTGADLTSVFTLATSYTGQDCTTTITAGGTGGYVTLLQFVGYSVTRKDATVEKTVDGSYGDQVLIVDMPYQDDVAIANGVATFLATALSTTTARIKQVRFLASKSSTFLDYAVSGEVGDRIAISERVTGLSASLFVIQRVSLRIEPAGILWCTWDLVPWGIDPYWTAACISATGGTKTTIGGYTVHTFTTNGTFTISSTCGNLAVEFLIAGGGAGSGSGGGIVGGGAGGQVVPGTASLAAGSYAVTVGAAGAAGANGGDSTFNSMTGQGGSHGGADGAAGANGTQGGGAGNASFLGSGAGGGDLGHPTLDWQSHPAGTGTLYPGGGDDINGAGGGAGAGGPGGAAAQNTGGNAGPGLASAITGASVTYATGGNGDGLTTNGAGALTTPGCGGSHGGSGHAGVVIIRYATPTTITTSTPWLVSDADGTTILLSDSDGSVLYPG